MSLTDRLERLAKLSEALELAVTIGQQPVSPVSPVGDLSDEDALRIRAAIQRVERGSR